MTHLILICAKPFLISPSLKPLPGPPERAEELGGLMGPYLTFIAAMYRVSKPQRPYLGHVIGLGAPLLSPPSGSCLGTLFRGVLIGLDFWYAKTVSANQH